MERSKESSNQPEPASNPILPPGQISRGGCAWSSEMMTYEIVLNREELSSESNRQNGDAFWQLYTSVDETKDGEVTEPTEKADMNGKGKEKADP